MRNIAWALMLLLVVGVGHVDGAWLKTVDIKVEPSGKTGESHYTVRLAPAKTLHYDTIVFELFYRQTFPRVSAGGKSTLKIHEPVSFVYRRQDVELVEDLDYHISFRVPLDRLDLEKTYGARVFHKDYPISIQRLTITGRSNGVALWTYDIPAAGRHEILALTAEQRVRDAGKTITENDPDDLLDVPDWLK